MTYLKHSSALLMLVLLAASVFAQPVVKGEQTNTEKARAIVDFCLANQNKCSLSIHHITGGWERHLNPDRLNPLASSWKVVPLLAYGQAVADGELDPNTSVNRNEWGRFFVGGDGNALRNAWMRFGQPENVTISQMVNAMMRESDNAAPDWLVNELGDARFRHVISRYVINDGAGYHDTPKLIAGLFVTWDENPVEPLIGERINSDFSDCGTYGYRGEVDEWATRLRQPAFVSSVQNYRCAFLPWVTPPACTPPTIETSEASVVRLQQNFYTRSNTRAHNRLMRGLLLRNLLPEDVQNVVEPQIELHDRDPNRFVRYGGKTGTLGTVGGLTVVNWTSYALTVGGTRVAVTLHLQGAGGYIPLQFAFDRQRLTEALAEDAAFAEETRNRIAAEVSKPDLHARLFHIATFRLRNRYFMTLGADVFNIGPRRMQDSSKVSFYLSQDSIFDSGDTRIARMNVRRLRTSDVDRGFAIAPVGTTTPVGKYLITVVDPDDDVDETNEAGNIQWEKIQADYSFAGEAQK